MNKGDGRADNLAGYTMAVLSKVLRRPVFGNLVYLGNGESIDPGADGDVIIKAGGSSDLQVLQISMSQDGTPVDRLDPWQSDVYMKGLEYTSELKDAQMQHVLDGEVLPGDLFGRDNYEPAVELLMKNEEIKFTFHNYDPFYSHYIHVNMRCAFWPPILTGLKPA